MEDSSFSEIKDPVFSEIKRFLRECFATWPFKFLIGNIEKSHLALVRLGPCRIKNQDPEGCFFQQVADISAFPEDVVPLLHVAAQSWNFILDTKHQTWAAAPELGIHGAFW